MSREVALTFCCEENDPIHEIRIIMCWHKGACKDWSVAIGGQLHTHISTDILEALIECEVIVAETSLTRQECTHEVRLVHQ
jgi:hypothetical protein